MPSRLIHIVFAPKLHQTFSADSAAAIGLGFAYSSIIIEAHGGSMIMESREGNRTVVKFALPIRTGSKFSDSPVRYGEGGMIQF